MNKLPDVLVSVPIALVGLGVLTGVASTLSAMPVWLVAAFATWCLAKGAA